VAATCLLCNAPPDCARTFVQTLHRVWTYRRAINRITSKPSGADFVFIARVYRSTLQAYAPDRS